MGIRVGDLLNKDAFSSQLSSILEFKNTMLTKVYGHPPLLLEEIFEQYSHYADELRPFIRDTNPIMMQAIRNNELVLLEGAQGALLDTDFGTYPYVTSSSPLAGAGSLGTGIGPTQINSVVGVFKAYVTRVGSGPMPTELKDELGELIREKAQEYGATTGRPRRCGWFDAVAGRLSVQVNGLSDIALTHLDIFDGFASIKICSAYKFDNKVLQSFPSNTATLEKCQPVYEELPGWQESTNEIRDFNKLPSAARHYIARLEQLLSCPISLISVGPKREQVIKAKPTFP
jgi:adenylosuccinate synthase